MNDVVIIGGGIVGCSVAFHLARAGRAVTLCERGQLTGGTTWHAAGLVAELRASRNLTRLARYTGELYEQLERDGYATGFKRTGALTLACSAARMEELTRTAAMARQLDVDVQVLAAGEIGERWPWLDVADLSGGVYMPNDGQTSPVDTTHALARAARHAGATIRERCPVLSINTRHGRVCGVQLADGHLEARHVVLCAGLWSHRLAAAAGVNVPLHAAEHYYVVTEPLAELPAQRPTVRDPDHALYIKDDAGRALVGSFELNAKPLPVEQLPEDFEFDQLPFDFDHFEPYLSAAIARMPTLANVGIRTWFNGPESFTPDDRYLLGEAPEVGGLFVASGFNSIGIQSAGGVGQVIAEWLIAGHAPMDLWDVDVRRMLPFQGSRAYLAERTRETVGLLYAMHWPRRQYASARNVRRSALHESLAAAGARFGELAGWERANWFGEAGADVEDWHNPGWLAASAREHLAVRNAVGLFDQSSFAKYLVVGRHAEAALNRLCTANIDVPVGRVIYCQWCNARGGIEADVTITRTGPEEFLVVSAAACQVRDMHWLRGNLAGDAHAIDITSAWAVIGVMGPNSRALLQTLTDTPLDNAAFAFGTSRMLHLASAAVRATRITYVGELGFELYVPTEYAVHVYQAILAAGEPHGLVHAGYYALDSLRLEKAYRHWGHDLSDEDTPLETGLGFTIAWDKPGGFIGREALAAQRQQGVRKRLCVFRIDAPDVLLWHDEPVWRDGQRVGHITSGGRGHHLGCTLGLGHVRADVPITPAWLRAGRWEIEVGQRRVPASIGLRAPHDPDNTRIRC